MALALRAVRPRLLPMALPLAVMALLGACTTFPDFATTPTEASPPDASRTVVNAAALAPPPPPTARTVDQFDTTTAAQRAAARAQPAAAGEQRLGTTIASLGPPAQAGLWMTTGLVNEVVMGRVEYPAKGTSVALELRPSGAAASAGSQISLAALRTLEAPLTGLPELVVYRD